MLSLLLVNYLFLNVVTKTKDNVVSVSAKKYQHQQASSLPFKRVRIEGWHKQSNQQANEEEQKKEIKEKRNKIACR